ncbi:MAG: sugar kinase [Sandaracinaceae bacterium]|nr:sugar kinase [Sandaracinaceae bacterium]
MSSMLVVGSVARDTIHNNQGTHPMVLGGSAVFASLASSFFVSPRMVGIVGTDFPDAEIEMLRRKGVDVSGLEVVDGKTFHWEGRYSPDLTSRESIKTELNVFGDFHPKIPEAFRDTPYVMLGNIHPSLQVEVLEQMRSPKLVIADTMNFWIEGTPKELAQMLGRIDLLVINEEEARLLGGVHNIAQVARKLLAMGPRVVVIKRGEYGALLFEGQRVFSAPAYPVEDVLDPTGAGDTFAGGMLGFLAQHGSADATTLRRAIIYGSALASFCVEGVSVSRLATVTQDELQRRYLEFARLAHFATDEEIRRIADQ